MPPTGVRSKRERTLEDVVAHLGVYPIEAFDFTHQGLQFAAARAHGEARSDGTAADADRHITGRQLCEGLRDLAIDRWGMMARTVLGTWHVESTHDFGRIVFAMIDAGLLQKQPGDTIADFEGVFEFRRAFDAGYAIRPPATIEG